MLQHLLFQHPQSGQKKMIQPLKTSKSLVLETGMVEDIQKQRWKVGCEICTSYSTSQRQEVLGGMPGLLLHALVW